MFRTVTAARACALLGALILINIMPPAFGQKPGGGSSGGTGGGTIYYEGPWDTATTGGTTVMKRMNSDGTGKSQMGLGLFGSPSFVEYGGHQWFLDVRGVGGNYPNGDVRREVFARRDDYHYSLNNTPETSVQLTYDATLQMTGADWIPGGQSISIQARRWSDNTVTDGGVYVAQLQFGPDGGIVGLTAPPASPTIAIPLNADLLPNCTSLSWDNTGARIVYDAPSGGLWIADILGNPHSQIVMGQLNHPEWSRDGSKIVFTNANGGISVVSPSGAGLKQIIRPSSQWFYHRPRWSPGGTHIVYCGYSASQSDVFRATSSGGSPTNLTSTSSPFHELTVGWR